MDGYIGNSVWTGSLKTKILKERRKLNKNFQSGGGGGEFKPFMGLGRYGYFLQEHISCHCESVSDFKRCLNSQIVRNFCNR